MRNASEHLPDWVLEQYAESALPAEDQANVAQHVDSCARCSAELEAYRTLFAALGELPRFAPSVDFNDAVMARIQVAPAPAPALAWLQGRLPQTAKGWSLVLGALLAPALPVLTLIAWVISQPLVSRDSLWTWTSTQTQQGAQALFTRLMDWGMGSGLYEWMQAVFTLTMNIPASSLTAGLAILAVGIPLSAWSLVRLVRPPLGRVDYAK